MEDRIAKRLQHRTILPNWVDQNLSPNGRLSGLSRTSPLPPVDIDSEERIEGIEEDPEAVARSEIARHQSGIVMRRTESTARSTAIAGAGFLWDENATMADFEQLKAQKEEIARHNALAKAELAKWTNNSPIMERLEKVARDEGQSKQIANRQQLLTSPPHPTHHV